MIFRICCNAPVATEATVMDRSWGSRWIKYPRLTRWHARSRRKSPCSPRKRHAATANGAGLCASAAFRYLSSLNLRVGTVAKHTNLTRSDLTHISGPDRRRSGGDGTDRQEPHHCRCLGKAHPPVEDRAGVSPFWKQPSFAYILDLFPHYIF